MRGETGATGPAGPQGPRGLAGPAGPPGPSLDLRVLVGEAKESCDASEVMISAYCADGTGSLHIVGTAGASCDGDPAAKAVVVCARR